MKIRILLFARYCEAAGTGSVEIEVPRGATIGHAWERVRETLPALRGETHPLLACDRAYVRPERVLSGTEEVAAFPPVSGG